MGIGLFNLVARERLGEMVTLDEALNIYGIPFSQLIDPTTLRVPNKHIELGGPVHTLLRAQELDVSRN